MPRWVGVTIAIVAVVTLFPLISALIANEEALRFADSAIHIAAKNGDMGKIGAALEAGAHIDAADEFGKTPLHHAAENGHVETTKSLLTRGADANLRDAQGHTALQLALDNGHSQTASALLEATTALSEAPERQGLNPSLKYPDLESFERAIEQPALLLKSRHVWLFAPEAFAKQAKIVHPYLTKAYDSLYGIVGAHTKYIIVIYNFPKGHPDASGGTSNCTIWYDDTNLKLDQHQEWTSHGVPHLSGYIEEMAHNFNYTQFGWEMVGWSIGIKTSQEIAQNPILKRQVEHTRNIQEQTYKRYKALGNTFPPGIEPNQVDRIHAHLLWQCEQQYGPAFWPDFFREAKKERTRLALGSRDERYTTTIQCFDRLPGLDFKQLLTTNGISLTTDIKSLDPTAPTWNRKLQ